METKKVLEQMTAKEVILKLAHKTARAEICRAYLANIHGSTKNYVSEFIEREHPSKPRTKALAGSNEEKLAELMADIMDSLPDDMVQEMNTMFLLRDRLPLISDFYNSFNIKDRPQNLQDLEELTAEAITKASKKKIKGIYESLAAKYPAEDLSMVIANTYIKQPQEMENLKAYVERAIENTHTGHQNGQSPAKLKFDALKRRLYWYWQRIGYEHEKTKDNLIMPPQYIIQEARNIRKQFTAIMGHIKADDPTWNSIATEMEDFQDFKELERAVELAETRAPILKQYRQDLDTATQAIQKLTRVTTKEEVPSLPILKFRREAQKLMAELSDQSALKEAAALAQQINSKKHPMAAILELIENDHLEIAQYDELKSIALKHPSHEMAMAAMRGKLKIEKEGEPLRRPKPQPAEAITPRSIQPTEQKPHQESPPCTTQPETHHQPKRPDKEFYDLLSKGNYARLAMEVLAGSADNPLLNIKAIAMHCFSMGWDKEAWGLAEHIEKDPCTDKSFALPSALLKAINISPYITESDRTAAEIYQLTALDIDTEACKVEKQFAWNQAISILTASALMVPALTAPSLGVMEHHAALVIKGCPGFSDLFTAIQQASKHYVAFTPNNITEALRWDETNAKHAKIVDEARQWHQKAMGANIKYAPARNLWSVWIGKKGFIGSIVTNATNDDRDNAENAASMAELIADAQIVTQEINQVARKLFSDRANAEISGPAKQTIITMSHEAAEITIKWARSVKQLKDSRPAAHVEQLLTDIKAIRNAIEPARLALSAMAKDTAGVPTKIATAYGLTAIDNIREIIDANYSKKPKDNSQITWDTISTAGQETEAILERIAEQDGAFAATQKNKPLN